MPAVARVVALYCGQGMAHLIEIYADGTPKAVADRLILVDFGGDSSYSGDAVDYVFTKLKAQSDAGRNAKLDLTVISHQDGDHLSLLAPLRTKIVNEGLVIQFGGVFLGGLKWSERSKDVVNDFFGISRTRPRYDWSDDQRSDYYNVTSRSKLGRLVEFNGFTFRVLISQLGLSKGGIDIRRNASSTVLVIENGTQSVVLPGDSTYQTMRYVNELYTAWGSNKLLPPVRALEVPHHGAIRTAVENYKASVYSGDLEMRIVRAFSKNLYADVAFASAGYLSSHGHPVKEVLDVFQPYTVDVAEHVYVAFVFDDKHGTKQERYDEFETEDAIVTTLIQIFGGTVWKNVTIRLPSRDAAAAVSNRHSLRELLVLDGLEPPDTMGHGPFSLAGIAPATAAPPPVYAAPPTAEERAGAARGRGEA